MKALPPLVILQNNSRTGSCYSEDACQHSSSRQQGLPTPQGPHSWARTKSQDLQGRKAVGRRRRRWRRRGRAGRAPMEPCSRLDLLPCVMLPRAKPHRLMPPAGGGGTGRAGISIPALERRCPTAPLSRRPLLLVQASSQVGSVSHSRLARPACPHSPPASARCAASPSRCLVLHLSAAAIVQPPSTLPVASFAHFFAPHFVEPRPPSAGPAGPCRLNPGSPCLVSNAPSACTHPQTPA